ncbi:hypothetical protein ACI5KX_09240 [Erythrobacter sp. GH1-10]|uniref:hypothetical protein n=1 Tax=Erythrobacter sp. GH1-10 TaxID=3349334 RepID=UPI003878360E
MNKTHRRDDPLRFRLYFVLMNICLFFAVVGLINWLVDPFQQENAPSWYMALVFVTSIFNGFVPLFLVVAKFMRDDYAEGLLRRCLVVMAYVAAIIPPILILGPWILYLALAGDGSLRPDFYVAFEDAFYETRVAPSTVVRNVWITFMGAFVVVFQFLRWRDSR